MAERDRITASTDKPIPAGQTEAEFREKERQATQQAMPKAAQTKPVEQPKVASFDKAKVDSPLRALEEHLNAATLLARDLPNSQELADFTAALMLSLRLLRDLATPNETETV